MTEEILIDNKLIEIKDKITSILDYDHYQYKDFAERASQLKAEVDGFIDELKSDLEDLRISEYSFQQLSDLTTALNTIYTKKTFNAIPISFIKARKGRWPSIKLVLDSFQTKISQELLEASNNVIVKHEDNVLNSYQVALLIIYLRDSKIIPYKIKEKTVVEYFEKLTGYSKDNLRNLASKKNQKNQITEIERNYDELIDIFKQIVSKIEADKKTAVLKKGRKKITK